MSFRMNSYTAPLEHLFALVLDFPQYPCLKQVLHDT